MTPSIRVGPHFFSELDAQLGELVATGLLVPAVTNTVQLVADGSTVLFRIDVDLTA